MCGIVAVWNRDGRPIEVDRLRNGVEALAHRGPDGEGYVLIDTRSGGFVECAGRESPSDGEPARALLESAAGASYDLALGHRRLAIVDLSAAGRQPMASPERDVWIAYNGMIYNFTDLRSELEAAGRTFRSRTDTEVVLEAYRHWGPAFVERLNGMWAFVIWDARTRTLLASRDRMGIKPLVYHASDRLVALSSEAKGLRPFLTGSSEIDGQALHHYLSLMQVPAPYTIDRRVRKLEPARLVQISTTRIEERAYWDPSPTGSDALDEREAAERIEALLADSVRMRLIADVPAGCLLSGGVDSSLVSALAARVKRPESLTTFSVTFPRLPDVDESPWARQVAEHLASDHVEIELSLDHVEVIPELIRLYDEPFAISSVLGVYQVARAASERVKILLSGDGGDELFAGYERYTHVDDRWELRGARRLAKLGVLARLDRERVAGVGQWVRWRPLSPSILARLALGSLRTDGERGRDLEFNGGRLMFNDVEKAALYDAAWRNSGPFVRTVDTLCSVVGPPSGDPVLRRQLMEVRTTLHDEMLAKVDRATMAWGIEARVPLLDHRVVESALRLPAACRYGGGEGKRVLKRIAARHVPHDVVYREKRGFTIPLADWLGGGLREFVRDSLTPTAIRRAGVFDARTVGEVVAWYERAPNFHTAHMVFTLLCFQLWYDAR